MNIPINPLEIAKNQLRRLMIDFNIDLDEAYDKTIFGFSYLDDDILRTVEGCSDKNSYDWYTAAYEQLKQESE